MVTKWKSQPYDVKKAHIELVSRMNTPAKYIVDDSPRKSPQFSSETIPKVSEPHVAAEQTEPQAPILAKPKSSSLIADLFLSPSAEPIVHSSRGIVYRSIPYSSQLSQHEKEFLDRSFDSAVLHPAGSINISPVPFNIKNGIWSKLVSAKKLDVSGRISSFDSQLAYKRTYLTVHFKYNLPQKLHINGYNQVEQTLYSYLSNPFSFKQVPESVYSSLNYGKTFRTVTIPKSCPAATSFTFLILSKPENVQQRYAIRHTWGSFKSMAQNRVVFIFAMGMSSSEAANREVTYENHRHKDILQFDHLDSAINSTQTVLHGFRWLASHCYSTKYIVKVQDDTSINLKPLVTTVLEVAGKSNPSFYFGSCVDEKWEYVRDKNSPYFIPSELVNDSVRWPWCSGSGFVISANLAPIITLTSYFMPWISGVADLEVGKALSIWNVRPYDIGNDRFANLHISQIPTSERFDHLGFSYMSPEDMYDAMP